MVLHTTLPKIGLGTYAIADDCLPGLVAEALKMGYSLFDTALAYPNESVLGAVLLSTGGDRRSYLVESKAPYKLLCGHRQLGYLDARHVRCAYRKTLKDVGLSQLDIYLLHTPFPGYHRHMRQLKRMKDRGEVALMGVCNISLEQLEHLYAHLHFLPDIVQVEVHPYFTNKQLIAYCQHHGVMVEARSPLAHGDAMQQWLQEPALLQLAQKYQKSIPQVILRWLTQQDIIPLPRTSNVHHLQENINIFDFSMTAAELASIDALNKNQSFGVKSGRYQA
ncbi:MAG: aldo/keto reductase [Bacteroidales bacterium]|nr:aldo/keto reductase [Bacteroidales bacterium]